METPGETGGNSADASGQDAGGGSSDVYFHVLAVLRFLKPRPADDDVRLARSPGAQHSEQDDDRRGAACQLGPANALHRDAQRRAYSAASIGVSIRREVERVGGEQREGI